MNADLEELVRAATQDAQKSHGKTSVGELLIATVLGEVVDAIHALATPPPPITSQEPQLVGTLDVWATDGRTGIQMRPLGRHPTPGQLYAWSDGVVTWTRDRSGQAVAEPRDAS